MAKWVAVHFAIFGYTTALDDTAVFGDIHDFAPTELSAQGNGRRVCYHPTAKQPFGKSVAMESLVVGKRGFNRRSFLTAAVAAPLAITGRESMEAANAIESVAPEVAALPPVGLPGVRYLAFGLSPFGGFGKSDGRSYWYSRFGFAPQSPFDVPEHDDDGFCTESAYGVDEHWETRLDVFRDVYRLNLPQLAIYQEAAHGKTIEGHGPDDGWYVGVEIFPAVGEIIWGLTDGKFWKAASERFDPDARAKRKAFKAFPFLASVCAQFGARFITPTAEEIAIIEAEHAANA